MKHGHVTGHKKAHGKATGYPSWLAEKMAETIRRLREAEAKK